MSNFLLFGVFFLGCVFSYHRPMFLSLYGRFYCVLNTICKYKIWFGHKNLSFAPFFIANFFFIFSHLKNKKYAKKVIYLSSYLLLHNILLLQLDSILFVIWILGTKIVLKIIKIINTRAQTNNNKHKIYIFIHRSAKRQTGQYVALKHTQKKHKTTLIQI